MRGCLLLLAIVGPAMSVPPAEAEILKREVFGQIGVGKAADDEGSLGSGVNGGGGFGYRVMPRLGVEAELNAFRTTREFASSLPAYRATGFHLMGNGLLYLSRGKAQVFILAGAGIVYAHVASGFAGSPAQTSGSGLAANVGFGVKGRVTEHLWVRPEIRVFAGSPGGVIEPLFSDLRASIGLGYRW